MDCNWATLPHKINEASELAEAAHPQHQVLLIRKLEKNMSIQTSFPAQYIMIIALNNTWFINSDESIIGFQCFP